MLARRRRRTHTRPLGAELSSCGCCKTNGRECEHGLCLALMASQVCLMSRCCDYQHGALAQLESPQVNHRGEASICTAGGPRTTLMGFHLLLGRWTFWKAPDHDAHGLLEGANTGAWLKLGTLGTQVLCLSWHVVHHVFHLEPEFPTVYVHVLGVWIYVRLCFCSHMGIGHACLYKFGFPVWRSQCRSPPRMHAISGNSALACCCPVSQFQGR